MAFLEILQEESFSIEINSNFKGATGNLKGVTRAKRPGDQAPRAPISAPPSSFLGSAPANNHTLVVRLLQLSRYSYTTIPIYHTSISIKCCITYN